MATANPTLITQPAQNTEFRQCESILRQCIAVTCTSLLLFLKHCTSAPTSTRYISRRLGGPNGRPGRAVIVLPGVDGIPQRRDGREASKDDAGVVH